MACGKLYFLCICTFLLLAVDKTLSSVSFIENTEDPAHPGLCHIKDAAGESLLLLKPGESKKHPAECSSVSCDKNYLVEIQGCGVPSVGKGCELVSTTPDSYPECCGTLKCK